MPVHRLDPGQRHSRPTTPGESTRLNTVQDRQTPVEMRTEQVARAGSGRHHRADVPTRPSARAATRRVPGHTPWADDRRAADKPAFRAPSRNRAEQGPEQVRSLRRVGIDRQSRRSLVLGGALVVAILGGAGVIAWAAKPATPRPAISVDAGNSTGRDDPSSSATNAQSILPDPTRDADPADELSAAGAAAPGPATDGTLPAAPSPADHRPATVSPLGPGDPGFGWPATAFGSVLIGPGT